jgi:hypothetical protein
MGNKSYSKAISWFDDCRIPTVSEKEINWSKQIPNEELGLYGGGKGFRPKQIIDMYNTQGRFPANLLVCDDMLNDGIVSNSTGGIPNGKPVYGRGSFNESKTINTQTKVGFGDKGTNSRYYDIDKWFNNLIDE